MLIRIAITSCVYHASASGKRRAGLINNSFWAHGCMANAHFAERRQNKYGAQKSYALNIGSKKPLIKKRALKCSRLYCKALPGALLCLFFQVEKSFEINH